MLISDHMGVQKSRKSVKYTKSSLKRTPYKKTHFCTLKLSQMYKKSHHKKARIFVILNKENAQSLFF